jgi:2,3-bisphosphoglycerate-independent phosphoglycerate mutase
MRSYTTEKIKSQPHTAHTTNLVPLVYIGRSATFLQEKTGTLSDIAPTLLHVMGIPQPEEMTGQSILKFIDEETSTVVDE